MILDRFGSLNDRLQPGVPCPEVPLFQESLSLFAVRLVEEILEYQADLIGTGGFEVLAREIGKCDPVAPCSGRSGLSATKIVSSSDPRKWQPPLAEPGPPPRSRFWSNGTG